MRKAHDGRIVGLVVTFAVIDARIVLGVCIRAQYVCINLRMDEQRLQKQAARMMASLYESPMVVYMHMYCQGIRTWLQDDRGDQKLCLLYSSYCCCSCCCFIEEGLFDYHIFYDGACVCMYIGISLVDGLARMVLLLVEFLPSSLSYSVAKAA